MPHTEQQLLEQFLADWRSDSPCITAHTSGSTGMPKPIQLLKADMRQSALATCRRFGIDCGSTLGLPLSLNYIAGKMMAVRSLVSGATLQLLPVSNRLNFGGVSGIESDGTLSATLYEDKGGEQRRIDLLSVVPSQVPSLLSDVDSALVGAVIIGGAPLSIEAERQLIASGLQAYASYGMTETCSHVALRRVGSPVYTAMPDIEFDTDSRGCLMVHCSRMSIGTLVTNDIVRLHNPATFEWLGRYDNVINSGGIKIMPEQLEAKLQSVIPYPFYISAVPHAKWGQAVGMTVECTVDQLAAVRRAVEAAVHGPERPVTYTHLPTLPRTQNGKIIRNFTGPGCGLRSS